MASESEQLKMTLNRLIDNAEDAARSAKLLDREGQAKHSAFFSILSYEELVKGYLITTGVTGRELQFHTTKFMHLRQAGEKLVNAIFEEAGLRKTLTEELGRDFGDLVDGMIEKIEATLREAYDLKSMREKLLYFDVDAPKKGFTGEGFAKSSLMYADAMSDLVIAARSAVNFGEGTVVLFNKKTRILFDGANFKFDFEKLN